MPSFRKIFARYLQGYQRTAVFALTSRCNCKCLMCNMHRKVPEEISLEDALHVLDALAKNRFLVAYFTGGEPTLHPNVVDIVSYAEKLGLVATMTTNGTAGKSLLKNLKDAGLYLLSVSLDHWDPVVCEKIRNHRDIFAKQVETLRYLKEIRLRTYALAYLNPILIHDGVSKLAAFVDKELGVPFGFCYPTTCNTNTYSLGGEDFGKRSDHLGCEVQRILEMKRDGGKIANLYCYVDDAVRFPSPSPNFYCRGGEDVVYVDWYGDVYPCFLKSQRLFNIPKGDKPHFLKDVKCNECLINCFREPSFLPQMFSPPHLFAKELYYSYPTRSVFR